MNSLNYTTQEKICPFRLALQMRPQIIKLGVEADNLLKGTLRFLFVLSNQTV